MGDVSTIGLDIAKSVFQVHGIDVAGAVVIRKRVLDEMHPLVDAEQRLALLRVRGHRDDQVVEDAQRPLHHIEMPVGERVEAAGVDGGFVGHTRNTVTIVSP